LSVSLKTEEDIETEVKFLNDTIQWASWKATPERRDTLNTYECPSLIKLKIEDKRRLGRN
jgi:hypothetical protein